MRREFLLPEDDVEHIDSLAVKWETISQQNGRWLLLHEFDFPVGYNHQNGSVAIQIPANYPVAGLDMAYFFPHLQRSDGVALRQTQCVMQIGQNQWQRWSRHYNWVPGQHNIGTHICLIRHWLDHGVGKG